MPVPRRKARCDSQCFAASVFRYALIHSSADVGVDFIGRSLTAWVLLERGMYLLRQIVKWLRDFLSAYTIGDFDHIAGV